MAQPIQLESPNVKALNKQLAALELDSGVNFLLHTPAWHITGWQAITRIEYGEPPCIIINGEEVPLYLCEATSDHQAWHAEPFWRQASIPEQQWLKIACPSGATNQILQLRASDSISPWQLLQLLRPDISNGDLDCLRPWLCNNGIHECNLLRQHPAVIAAVNQAIAGTDITWLHWAIKQERTDLQAAFKPGEAEAFLHWLNHHGASEHHLTPINAQGRLVADKPPLRLWRDRTFGVNLFGYANEALGIGEDLRTVHAALLSAGVPVAMVDIPCHHSSRELRNQARHNPDQLAPYALNLVCLTAEEHARVLLELGEAIFKERYCIGYWPWELSRWPSAWQPLMALADEIWASSRHTQKAIQTALNGREQPRLQLHPLPLQPLQPLSAAERQRWRLYFKLPAESTLVICSFDGRSSYARKNPWGAIDAFQEAFNDTTSVHLVIKTMHGGMSNHHWDDLQNRVAENQQLQLIDAVLDRDELLGLYGCCDILISLHRAEGYGRVLAEALVLGLDVIATDYSGNTDFCIGPQAYPVRYARVAVLPNEYPHSRQQHWAEPDVNHAQHLLREAIKRRAHRASTQKNPDTTAYQQLFNLEAIGQQYKKRLLDIYSKNNDPDLQLRWPQT